MKRAPVENIDKQIAAAVAVVEDVCANMAADGAARATLLPALIAATETVDRLKFERAEIIRTTFFRKGGR